MNRARPCAYPAVSSEHCQVALIVRVTSASPVLFFATTLLTVEDKSAPSGPMSEASGFMVSCGVRLWVCGSGEFRKPQVSVQSGSPAPMNRFPALSACFQAQWHPARDLGSTYFSAMRIGGVK
jgi:hypothetical protein